MFLLHLSAALGAAGGLQSNHQTSPPHLFLQPQDLGLVAGREEREGNAMGSRLRGNSYGWVSLEAETVGQRQAAMGWRGCRETDRQTDRRGARGTLHWQEGLGNRAG